MIWLIGSGGMLGKELAAMLASRGMQFIGTDREVDITNPESIDSFIKEKTKSGAIDWVVNCAAYTAVDKAEDDIALCAKINAEGPANIARAASRIGARMIHLSTDYVFDGKGTEPYTENDGTNPIGVYGRTKRDGELAALAACLELYIVRTSWLYGIHGNNFVKTMLRLMNEREKVSVVNDQRGSPTWAYDLCDALVSIITKSPKGTNAIPFGIYHFSNRGNITWYDFAGEIYRMGRKAGLIARECAVEPCTSDQYPSRVTRPAYSVLAKSKIESALGVSIPEWDISLNRYLTLTKESSQER